MLASKLAWHMTISQYVVNIWAISLLTNDTDFLKHPKQELAINAKHTILRTYTKSKTTAITSTLSAVPNKATILNFTNLI